jgi:hypothetical protein
MWQPGDRVTHRFHAELGLGRIVEIHGRTLRVEFPDARQTLSFATGTDALVPLTVTPGGRARLEPSGEIVVVESCEDGRCLLTDGREVALDDLWPLPAEISPVERLARGNVDAFACCGCAGPAASARSSAGASSSSRTSSTRPSAPA